MKPEGIWCTGDIDNEHLQLTVSSTTEKNSFFKLCNECYVVFFREGIFDYSFDFNSIWVDKDLERKIRLCFNKLSKYKKLPVVYLIIDHRYLSESKWYLQVHFYFHWLEKLQVGEVLKKLNDEIAKKQSNSY